MRPVSIPQAVRRARPWARVDAVNPPPGDSGEGIQPLEALHGSERTGTVTRYAFYTHWRPSPHELKLLAAGGTIEVAVLGEQLAPHGLVVWPK